jgi:hypothetical protein
MTFCCCFCCCNKRAFTKFEEISKRLEEKDEIIDRLQAQIYESQKANDFYRENVESNIYTARLVENVVEEPNSQIISEVDSHCENDPIKQTSKKRIKNKTKSKEFF